MEKEVGKKTDANSIIVSDDFRSYSKLKDHVWVHEAHKVSPKESGKIIPWVHTMISNAKRTLLGIYHMVSKKYNQDYLDEFCYKVNRRYFGENLFDKLLIADATCNYKNYVNVYR